jgi:hypothetical protein
MELICERMASAAEVRFCGTIMVISRRELAIFCHLLLIQSEQNFSLAALLQAWRETKVCKNSSWKRTAQGLSQSW